jgi:hypothetical protein
LIAVLVSHSRRRAGLANAEGGYEPTNSFCTSEPLSSSTFRNYIQPEPRFRALLTEGDARTLFYRKEFDWLGEESV